MKIAKTAAVGSLVALTGAVILCYHAPLVPVCILRPDKTMIENESQLRLSAPLSTLGVTAFVLGLLITVGGIANASRYGAVSARCRKLILLAGAATTLAGGPMLLTTVRFLLFARAWLGSPDPKSFFRSHSPTDFGLLYVSFALLAAATVFLFAASGLGIERHPPKRLHRLTAIGVGFVVITALAFGGAFRESCLIATRWSNQVVWSDPWNYFAPLRSIAVAQVIAGACLLALGVAIAAFAILVRRRADD